MFNIAFLNPAIVIFLKNPVLGRSKTRLARDIGDQKALAIYELMVRHTVNQAISTSAEVHLFYSHTAPPYFDWDQGVSVHLDFQSGSDLGERMSLAFAKMCGRHSEVLLIGSDCPELTKKQLEEGFALLAENDIVIGPAEDGGYYLIGMKDHHPELFEGMSYSHDQVFELTMKRAQRVNLQVGNLETLGDIDTLEDLEKTLSSKKGPLELKTIIRRLFSR